MKNTLRTKLTTAIIMLTIFFLLFSLVLNRFFLEKYYVNQTKKTILDVGESLKAIKVNQDDITDEVEKIERTKGVRIFILSENYESLFEMFTNPQPPMRMERRGNAGKYEPQLNGRSRRNLDRFRKIIETNKQKINKAGYIYNEYFDKRIGTNLIELIYLTDNKNYIIVSKPMIAIKESATIAARFFIFSGILTMVFGVLFAVIFSKKFIKPIAELNEIAGEMAKMNFTKKYSINSEDEIGELGKSLNILSENLDENIRELKNVNEKLQEEVEHERQLEGMRKEFVSNVSHELKTPVALIQGYAEGLRDNVNEDVENREFYCEVIVDESHKMNKLINELLNLAQMESGNYKMEKIEMDISGILGKTVAKYEMVFKEKKLNINTKIEKGLLVLGDEQKIEQVIVNYINNAINHVDRKQKIDIKLKREANKVKLSVFNTGENIPEQARERIWESFYKVDQARTREYGGTGLGLSIVKAIINQHGGKYGVENRENGVEFWFEVDVFSN